MTKDQGEEPKAHGAKPQAQDGTLPKGQEGPKAGRGAPAGSEATPGEALARVVQAQLILLDPIKRAHFDETGECDETATPDNTRAGALEAIEHFIGPLIDDYIASMFDGTKDPRRRDLVAEFREYAEQNRATIHQTLRQMNRAEKFLADMLTRFKGEPSRPIERGIERRLQMAKTVRAKAREDDQRWVLAIAIMEAYSFRFDVPEPTESGGYAGYATTQPNESVQAMFDRINRQNGNF